MNNIKIGVFDSGVGGLSIVNAIKKELPQLQIIYKEDKDNVPYGNKKPEQLLQFVVPIFQELENEGCKVIVVACNTVTTTIIANLRKIINIPLVAVEPMVKPASKLSKSGTIAVCATPTTLSSKRYNDLKKLYATNIKVVEPDCSDWASMIEAGNINKDTIRTRISQVLDKGADVIVLGCTHYHWIEDEINELAKNRA